MAVSKTAHPAAGNDKNNAGNGKKIFMKKADSLQGTRLRLVRADVV